MNLLVLSREDGNMFIIWELYTDHILIFPIKKQQVKATGLPF